MSLTWECPCCYKLSLSAEMQKELNIRVADHIRFHEIRAVDNARVTCGDEKCSLGRNKVFSFKRNEWEPKLTAYDRGFLRSMKIETDDELY